MKHSALFHFSLFLFTFTFCGCKAFYENAGSRTRVGSITAPVEVSEPSSSIQVRALYSMDGADVYTAKDSLVKITYRNSYTNNYFAIVKTHGEQDLEVEIEPLDTGSHSTNDLCRCTKNKDGEGFAFPSLSGSRESAISAETGDLN